MGSLDVVVVALYLLLTLGTGLLRSRRQQTASEYFLGARDLPAWAVLLSIVATETSALTVISVPGIGARGNLTFLQLAFGYLIGRIGVSLWLLPGYFRGDQETAYQRLESRFGARVRQGVSIVFLITRFLGDSVRIFAGAIPLALLTGWSVPVAIIIMGGVTLVYTYFGGLAAVVWADVMQLGVYVAGGIAALVIAWQITGGPGIALAAATAAGKLQVIDGSLSLSIPYTLLGGIVGGALLSAASHGTDHLIVQRLLATRSLTAARTALIGSGVVVGLQFLLFLLIGSAIWAAGHAPPELASDQIYPRFVLEHLPAGLAGLTIAGVLAASMGTHSSAINAMASSLTHDVYATWTGRDDPHHLYRVGRIVSLGWGTALVAGALAFTVGSAASGTPVVVLALSIASVTSGPLLAAFLLAGIARVRGGDVFVAVGITVPAMLVILFAKPLVTTTGWQWLEPVSRLAFPWYVVVGTMIALLAGLISAQFRTVVTAQERVR